ncbi:MAG: hypothetical protein JWM63_1012 [Gammaproteobacteria bacterium]|jgi:hypothetical protein|nr:hypothetical protein [Gammaproteobacteria bacterium]
MIRLTMVGPQASAIVAATSAYFRVTGGVVWVRPEDGPVATYEEEEGWRHNGVLWPGMRFEGQCRLILGLPRDPTSISEVLQSVSIGGRVLRANAIPIAVYDDKAQTWRGVTAGSWWPAFRIEVADLRKSLTKPTLLGDVLQLPNRRKDPQAVRR